MIDNDHELDAGPLGRGLLEDGRGAQAGSICAGGQTSIHGRVRFEGDPGKAGAHLRAHGSASRRRSQSWRTFGHHPSDFRVEGDKRQREVYEEGRG